MLVASYGLVTRDVELLKTVRFGTLVLDEAQAVKNAAGPPRDDARAIAYLEQGLAIGDLGERDRETLLERLEEVRRGAAGGQDVPRPP